MNSLKSWQGIIQNLIKILKVSEVFLNFHENYGMKVLSELNKFIYKLNKKLCKNNN